MKYLFIILLFLIGLIGCERSGKTKTSDAKIETIEKKVQSDDTTKTNASNISSALANSQEVKDNNSRDALMAYNAGVQYYHKGDLENALIQFKKALEKSPEYSTASRFIGRIYNDKGQKELSVSYYEDALRNSINDSVSILAIGQIYFDMGDYFQAMEYYDKTIEVAPNYAQAYFNRGTLLGMQDKYIEALDDLNESIRFDPNNGDAYVNRGLAYFYLKQMNSACRDWQKASDMGIEKATEAVEQYCK